MDRVSLGQALTALPEVSPRVWRSSTLLTRWLVSMRAGVLVMTVGSAALGGLLAAGHPHWDPLAWIGVLIGLSLAHGANNQLNDLTDHRRGIDRGSYFRTRYGTHVLEQGLLSEGGLWTYAAVTGGMALAIGLWLLARTGPVVLPPLLAGSVLLIFYTWPLKQWGLGEPAVWLVWGPLMVGGTVCASTGEWSWQAVVVGGVYALGPTTVIFGKHLDKIDFDRAKGVATLPVRLGARTTRGVLRWLLWLQYPGIAALALVGWLPATVLLALLAIPKAWRFDRMLRQPAPDARPAAYSEQIWPLWFAAAAFDHTRQLGLLFLGGALLGYILRLIVL